MTIKTRFLSGIRYPDGRAIRDSFARLIGVARLGRPASPKPETTDVLGSDRLREMGL